MAAPPPNLECRMYESRYPEVDMAVMIQVKSIADMGAYVSLLEYNNIEGMILFSELSRRRIRSISSLIRVGRQEPVMVLRVDREKGYIDLSKRRVSEDINACEERYNKSKLVHSIMRHVAETMSLDLEDLYIHVGWPLYRKYGHAFEAFKLVVADPDAILDPLTREVKEAGPDGQEVTKTLPALTEEVKDALVRNIRRRMTPQPLKIRADIELKCFQFDGVLHIKESMRKAEAVGNDDCPVKIKLVAPPLYVLTTQTLDKVFLKHIPRNIIIAFVEAIEKGHYYFYFKDYLNKCDIIKHDSDPNHIYGILLKMPELDVMFTKVDKADLLYAIEEHIFKVQNKRRDNMRHNYANYLPNCKFIMPQSDSYKDLEEINREGLFDELTSDDKETGLRLYKRFLYFHHPTKENPVPKFYCIGFHMNGREEEEAAPTNPIYNLIFQIRRGKHNMHLNPEVELEKIRKSDPSFYYEYFVDWSPQKTFAFVPPRMVTVSDVPFGISVQDMKKFFSSCGDVEYVHIYRGDRKKKSHCVLVKFKESAGAKCAVLLSGTEMTIRGTTKVITVQPDSDELVVTSELPKPLDLVAAEAIVSSLEKSEDVGSVLAQVLEKYWLFSKYVEPGRV